MGRRRKAIYTTEGKAKRRILMLMKPEAIYHIMADRLRLVLAFLHIKIENIEYSNYK